MAERRGSGLLASLDGQQASINTKEHAVYAYFFLGFKLARIATIYRKGESTISRWIDRYRQTGDVSRLSFTKSNAKFSKEQRQWIFEYIMKNPLSFLDETRRAFMLQWNMSISKSSVWRLMRESNLSYKVSIRCSGLCFCKIIPIRQVIERQAMHISVADIIRFFRELSSLQWTHESLVFLDEVSFDNRGMLRRRGYALKVGNIY